MGGGGVRPTVFVNWQGVPDTDKCMDSVRCHRQEKLHGVIAGVETQEFLVPW